MSNRRTSWILCVSGLATLALTNSVSAEVRLPALISDHMLLQQEVPVRIWGWANPGEQVRVQFGGQNLSAVADSLGDWEAFLAPLEAGGPFQMVIAGDNTITLTDVLVGEVWVASGQSNMVWSVKRSRNADAEISHAEFPRIRLFKVALKVADQPWRTSRAAGKGVLRNLWLTSLQSATSLHVTCTRRGGTPWV